MNNRNQHSKAWTHCVVLGSNPNDDNVSMQMDSSHNIKTVDNQVNKRHYTGKVVLGSTDGAGAYADTLPIPTYDTNNNRSGWYHHKIAGNTDKLNYYFYSEGNTPFLLKDITNVKATVIIDNYTNSSSIPFFCVYTKPTGVNDAQPWYHSKRCFTISPGERIIVGERIQMYALNKGFNPKGHRQVEFNSVVDTGECIDTEEILTMSIHTDSGSPIDTRLLVKALGYETAQDIEVNLELD